MVYPVASTAPQSLLPARPPVAKGGGKGKGAAAKPKALSKKDIPPGFKRCSTCLEALPEASFDDKRNVCKDDDLACESLQRVLRKKWGNNYKSRVTRVKKAGIWNQGVVAFRVSTQGQKRRVLPGAQDQLAEQSIKAHKKRRMSQRRKMTFFAFNLYYSAPEDGGYSADLIKQKWAHETSSKPPVDTLGVVSGIGGQSSRHHYEAPAAPVTSPRFQWLQLLSPSEV